MAINSGVTPYDYMTVGIQGVGYDILVVSSPDTALSVPEPNSMVLLFTMLLAVALVVRKWIAQNL